MMLFSLLVAALAILPSDRLVMADRLFNRGEYGLAKAEYTALRGSSELDGDAILFRLGECERALGNEKGAKLIYEELIKSHHNSKYVDRARLQIALSSEGAEREKALRVLDSNGVEASLRAEALYHLGLITGNVDYYTRSKTLSGKGRIYNHALFRESVILSEKGETPQIRRKAIGQLYTIGLDKSNTLADDAMYVAAMRSFAEKKYSESSAVFEQYEKLFPKGKHLGEVRAMSVWSEFLAGNYAKALSLCGKGDSDDTLYIKAACAQATGDTSGAYTLYKQYLERFPQGKYRNASSLYCARMDYSRYERAKSYNQALEAAKQAYALSKNPGDQLSIAWVYEKLEKTDDALREYIAISTQHPGSEYAAEAMFRKAMIDITAKRYAAAELSLKEMLSSNTMHKRKGEALFWRAVASEQLGHSVESVEFAKEACKVGLSIDREREARLMIADGDYNSGKTDLALRSYVDLINEGAIERMSAAKIHAVGRFILNKGTKDDVAAVKKCAKALSEEEDSEWRQAGAFLEGDAEMSMNEFNAAVSAYRRGFKENVRVEGAANAALSLGELESRSGEYDKADETLKEAVKLNVNSQNNRAKAYLLLARNAEGGGRLKDAEAYATVVINLFNYPELKKEAEKILENCGRKE